MITLRPALTGLVLALWLIAPAGASAPAAATIEPATANTATVDPTAPAPATSTASTPALAGGTRPAPFKARYKATYSGMGVSADRSLQQRADGSWEYRFDAKSWLAEINERSLFHWGTDGLLVPRQYTYQRRVLGRNRDIELNFDWRNKVATSVSKDKSRQIPLTDSVFDKLSYQLQLRQDLINRKSEFDYQVVDGSRLKTYTFAVTGEERLDTAAGPLNTIVVERVREDSERSTILWFARDWDYLLVRIQQVEEDGQDYEINLDSAVVNGATVKGAR